MASVIYGHNVPTCMVSHHFINQLSAIVGSCDILKERTEHAEQGDPQCAKRIASIRGIAMDLIGEMRTGACDLDLQAKAAVLCQTIDGVEPQQCVSSENH